MTGVTKAVSDRLDLGRTVVSSVQTHGPDVAAALTAVLFPQGAPASFTVPELLAVLAGALTNAGDALAQADVAHAAELADDAAPRRARDEAFTELREQVMGARTTLASVYGNRILVSYDLAGETPEDTDLLLQRATSVAGLLETRAITEKPRQMGVSVDAQAIAKAMRDTMTTLRRALDDVRREEREAQLTLARRNDAAATWSERYQGVADIVTGIYELVGRNELADVVRPTMRRRSAAAEEVPVKNEGLDGHHDDDQHRARQDAHREGAAGVKPPRGGHSPPRLVPAQSVIFGAPVSSTASAASASDSASTGSATGGSAKGSCGAAAEAGGCLCGFCPAGVWFFRGATLAG
jgi:hypothetical protein